MRWGSLAAALAVLSPLCAIAQPDCPRFFAGGLPPALVRQSLTQRTTMLCNEAYASLASGVTHGALWSAEHPTTASLTAAGDTPRQGDFHPDQRLPEADQAQLADYRRSGFDRGHMTPSGDMPTETAQEQSFSLANIVPQTAKLNRGVWERIETALRDLASREGELYVVTGAAFQGEHLQAIGPDGVLVPSSVWKAIYDPQAGGAGAYVCDNTPAPTCVTMSVADLTRTVGIDAFPALSQSLKSVAMDLPRPKGRRHDRRRKRQTALEQLLAQ